MKYFSIFLAILVSTAVFAEDSLLNLNPGDTVLAICDGGDECLPCDGGDPSLGFPFGHGGSHKHEAKLGDIDCRLCHGTDLLGGPASITSKNVSCIAPDGLVLPVGVEPVPVERANGEILTDYEGTTIGILPKGIPVGCNLCHEEIEIEVNGRELEFDFEDWRDANFDGNGGDNGGDNGGECPEPEGRSPGDRHNQQDLNCLSCHAICDERLDR